jgi:hypothetical protein
LKKIVELVDNLKKVFVVAKFFTIKFRIEKRGI